MSLASIILCSTTLFFLVLFKQFKVFSQKIVIYLFVAAILQSTAFLLNKLDFDTTKTNTNSYVAFCMFSGFLTQITTWMFQGAVLAITVYLFVLIVINYDTSKYELVYVLGIFALPLVVNWIPFINGTYHRAGLWCWIRSFNDETCKSIRFGEVLEYVLYFLPIYLVIVVGFILYVIMFIDIFTKLRKSRYTNDIAKQQRLKLMRTELISLAAYPVIFFFLNIPIITNRIHGSVNPTKPSLFLWYLASIAGPLQGIVTVITFTTATKWWKNLSTMKLKAPFVRSKNAESYTIDDTAISDSLETTVRHYRAKYSRYKGEDREQS